jgi:flavorubredoxin
MTEITNLTDSIYWLRDCHDVGDGQHIHVSQYIIEVGDHYVLVDAGGDFEGGLKDAILECTDGQGIDTLLLTHSILPHMRNANVVQEEWEDVTVISAASTPVIVGLRNAESKVMNSTKEVLGEDFVFLDPLLTDVVNSNWIFYPKEGVLFTAEGIGHYHDPAQCAATSADLDDGIPYDHVHAFHRDKLPFLAYIDPEKLRRGFESVFDRFDTEYIAPIHGTPVERPDIDQYVDRIIQSAEAFARQDTVEFPVASPDHP